MSVIWIPIKSCSRLHTGLKMPPADNNNSFEPTSIPLETFHRSLEKAELVEKPHRLTFEQGPRYKVTTLVVAWISVVITLSLGILAVAFSASEQSSASFAFGLDALLDTLSSLMVIWRFTGSAGSLYSLRKEKIACIAIGVLFLVAFVTVTARSAISIAWEVHPENNSFLWRLSIVNGTLCAVLAVSKFYLGWKLESISVITDGFNSVIGAILGFSTAVSVLIFTRNPSVWYLDAVCGLVCAAMLFVYGVWLIYSSLKVF